MPTNAEIFAGSNKTFNLDNIIQVAKVHRNKDLVDMFNNNRTVGRIHISTVGARISRSLDFIANRDGTDRGELKASFEAIRARNGVAGKNQHITGARSAVSQAGGGTSGRVKKAPAAGPSKSAAPRRDSVVSDTATTSQPRRQSVRQSVRAATGAPVPASVAGKKRARAASGAAADAESQHDNRPTKAAKTASSPRRSSSSAQETSGACDTAGNTTSQPRRGTATTGSSSSSSDSDSNLRRRFSRRLDDAEIDSLLGSDSAIDDDAVLEFARRMTIPEMVRAANRAKGQRFWTAGRVARRIAVAVERLAERRETSVRVQVERLAIQREGNGVEAGGMGRLRAGR